jgi:hypothetical protein
MPNNRRRVRLAPLRRNAPALDAPPSPATLAPTTRGTPWTIRMMHCRPRPPAPFRLSGPRHAAATRFALYDGAAPFDSPGYAALIAWLFEGKDAFPFDPFPGATASPIPGEAAVPLDPLPATPRSSRGWMKGKPLSTPRHADDLRSGAASLRATRPLRSISEDTRAFPAEEPATTPATPRGAAIMTPAGPGNIA